MKRILYDLTSAQPNHGIKVNGGGEYAYRLLWMIAELTKYEIIILLSKNKGDISIGDVAGRDLRKSAYYYKSLNEVEDLINNSKYDALILPVCYPEYGNLNISETQLVITTVHDLSTIYTDYVCNEERYVGLSLKNKIYEYIKHYIFYKTVAQKHINDHQKLLNITKNQLLITVSQYSKYAMEYYLETKQRDIAVLYPFADKEQNYQLSSDLPLIDKYNISSEQFYLLVSCNRWHKNSFFVMKVIDNMINKGIWREKYKVVLTGTDNAHRKFYEKHIKNIEYFVFLEYVDSCVLQELYAKAKALIYPSLYEGFGYPPMEAMKYGTQVIASTATSIPEVCGTNAHYFSPTNAEQLSVAILQSFDIERKHVEKALKEHYRMVRTKQDEDANKLIELIKFKMKENDNE